MAASEREPVSVFVQPTGLYSRAMLRVAAALERHAPPFVQFVNRPEDADLRVLHVIGYGSYDGVDENQPHVVIQYCVNSAKHRVPGWWLAKWHQAELVWSYYDLPTLTGASMPNFFYQPLGVDPVFDLNGAATNGHKKFGVVTSGYVSGPHAEPIAEVAEAAYASGKLVAHIGPADVEGMSHTFPGWTSMLDISDEQLRDVYSQSRWVSGLRHIEGFELPVIEGLACGARPIVFDRPETRKWFDGFVEFVPECCGPELVTRLVEVFRHSPVVTLEERQAVRRAFAWEPIVQAFWGRLL